MKILKKNMPETRLVFETNKSLIRPPHGGCPNCCPIVLDVERCRPYNTVDRKLYICCEAAKNRNTVLFDDGGDVKIDVWTCDRSHEKGGVGEAYSISHHSFVIVVFGWCFIRVRKGDEPC